MQLLQALIPAPPMLHRLLALLLDIVNGVEHVNLILPHLIATELMKWLRVEQGDYTLQEEQFVNH